MPHIDTYWIYHYVISSLVHEEVLKSEMQQQSAFSTLFEIERKE